MPWLILWVEPVPFTAHRGVTIYHTYNHMEATRGFHDFRFTTSHSDADERFHFDVRHLPMAGDLAGTSEEVHEAVRALIHAAIRRGVLTQEEPPRLSGQAD